jgi:hypothetical protein
VDFLFTVVFRRANGTAFATHQYRNKSMKDKAIKILLGIAIIAIWGTIINRIMNGNSDEGIIVPPKSVINTQKAGIEKFNLLLDYGDPFLSNTLALNASTEDNLVDSSLFVLPPSPPKSKPKKIVRFPVVQYQGMSKSNNRLEAIALVKIDRKTYLMRIGDEQNKVTIMNIYRDSIRVEKEGSFKTYERGRK